MEGSTEENKSPLSRYYAPGYTYTPPHPSAYRSLQHLAIKECSLLLASSSIFRRNLLANAAIPFGSFSVPFDETDVQEWMETNHPTLPAGTRTIVIAQIKADAAVHALRGPHTERLQQLRFLNQVNNIPPDERVQAIQMADKAARTTGAAAAAVAHLATYTGAAAALEAAEGRRPIVIAVDSGVEMAGQVRFRPKSKRQAEDFLRSYSNAKEPVGVITSVVLIDLLQEIDSPPWDPNRPSTPSLGCPQRCYACGRPKRSEYGSERRTPTSRSRRGSNKEGEEDTCSCPPTVMHAATILESCGGRPMEYRNGSRVAFTVRSEIWFNPMNKRVIKAIIKEGEVLYSAGAVIIEQGEMKNFIKSVYGCAHNVIGLPMEELHDRIRELLAKSKEK